ncbi:hypothetical protein [Lacticaseibacillus pantheris]|uniref:hypothetical protein n=1 Tax=Lacticaseibacillus pantheris TaxID=171523 RepID=UPI002659FF82|nr:hypothetical protein [Lacticaseibacillus pantheris]WKF85202.1 hypothetical protein QY874_00910 [Lacticaseibacillus pantheris]
MNYWLKADYYIAYGLWDQWSADQQRRLLNSAMNPPGDMTFLWLQLLIRAEQVALRNGDGETVRLCIDLCWETTIPSVRTQQMFLLRIAKLTLVDALDHSMESVAALDQLQDDLAIVATPFYCDLLRDTRAALTTAHNNGLVVATSNKQQATSNKQQATSNKQQATSNKQQATSNKQQATSNKQQATSVRRAVNDVIESINSTSRKLGAASVGPVSGGVWGRRGNHCQGVPP